MVSIENILMSRTASQKIEEELVEKIISDGIIVRLERVVSPESNTPSEVYDQEEDEFVLLVKGYAELEVKAQTGGWERVIMLGGDYTNIPAHLKHRVIRTEEGTTWLCLFYRR